MDSRELKDKAEALRARASDIQETIAREQAEVVDLNREADTIEDEVRLMEDMEDRVEVLDRESDALLRRIT